MKHRAAAAIPPCSTACVWPTRPALSAQQVVLSERIVHSLIDYSPGNRSRRSMRGSKRANMDSALGGTRSKLASDDDVVSH